LIAMIEPCLAKMIALKCVSALFISLFPGVGVIFGTAVMARRTGRRDRGVRGIPGTVADRGAGVARVGDGPSVGGAGGIRGTCAEGERGRR
jgi:hypothetical protein